MRDDSKDLGITEVIDDKVILPDEVMENLHMKPDDYVEIFSYSGIGQMEFSGLSYVDDDYGIYIPDEILEKLGNRDQAHFLMGKDMVIVRIEAEKEEEQELSTRLRQAIRGTLTTKKPPVEMRLYKHVCDVIRYGSSHDYIPLGNTCALCGEVLKGRENIITYKTMKPICVRCGKDVTGNFCGNCGLKLHRKEKGRVCSTCGDKLEYLDKWGRFYCHQCGKYERAIKPGVKNATCPDCGKQISFVKKYNVWYCFECDGYRRPLEITPDDEKGTCSDCGGNLTYVKKYDRFYCRKCESYNESDGVEQNKDEPPQRETTLSTKKKVGKDKKKDFRKDGKKSGGK